MNENQQRAASLTAIPRAANAKVHIRSVTGFFVGGRGSGGAAGVVNPGEIVEVTRPEAFDIIATGRGELASPAEVAAGPMADFKPKDISGNVIAPDTRSRIQIHADLRRAQLRSQSQNQQGPGRGAA